MKKIYIISFILICIFTLFCTLFFFDEKNISWKLVADKIFLNSNNLLWSKSKNDDYFNPRFKYLLYPKSDSVYIYTDETFKTKLKKINRAILISEDERMQKCDYFTVILNEQSDAYIKRSTLCYYLSDENKKQIYIENYNKFLKENRKYIYWQEVSCKYISKLKNIIVTRLNVLGKGEVLVFKYTIYTSLHNALPDACYGKIHGFRGQNLLKVHK